MVFGSPNSATPWDIGLVKVEIQIDLNLTDKRSMKSGKILKVFVMGKDPRSLKSVELVNWTGQAFIGRKDHLGQVRQRDELAEPGVYLLLSDGSDDGGAIDIYIGETDNFSERLASHAHQKTYWSQFVVFVSKDKNLTKAHVKHLERELYLLAQKAIGTLIVKNSSVPSGSSLPESDIAAMSEFMDNIVFVLETLGLSYFPTQHSTEELSEETVQERKWSDPAMSNGMEFYITLPKKLVPEGHEQPRAFMTVRDGAYILKAGSFVRKSVREGFEGHTYHEVWAKIIASDMVEKTPYEDLLKTTKDVEFRSPSGAGAIARGGQTNGRTEWKRLSDNLPLNECEAEQISAA